MAVALGIGTLIGFAARWDWDDDQNIKASSIARAAKALELANPQIVPGTCP